MKSIIRVFYKRPILNSLIFSLVITVVFLLLKYAFHSNYLIGSNFKEIGGLLLGYSLVITYPVILTVLNLFFLFCTNQNPEYIIAGKRIEVTTIILGIEFSALYLWLGLYNIIFSDWWEQLYNAERHSPVAKDMLPTIVVLSVIAIIGYIILRVIPLSKLAPLVVTLSISAMYFGIAQCGIWIVQLFKVDIGILALCLFPLNCIIIATKTVKELVIQWKAEHDTGEEYEKYNGKPLLAKFNELLNNSGNWPWMALILAVPFLGILIGVLALFGQAPDSIIKAWSETADWNLSKHVGPQNIFRDEHYLCTVAAGGHEKIVKPIRLGKRHGHQVIVNRQLCIANAFEQIFEERTPGLHNFIRYLYDKYGYPIAKHIQSRYVADTIYILMKPAEWIFLAVIYLCDTKPENRIAVQYLPQSFMENK
ncbi:MAG: DUF6688 family protein [Clostridium sp.]